MKIFNAIVTIALTTLLSMTNVFSQSSLDLVVDNQIPAGQVSVDYAFERIDLSEVTFDFFIKKVES